jgi:orotate phosphoribosyltransferase-like protein
MDIQRALDLREQGAQWNEIAAELGVPLYTVRYNCDLAGVQRRHYKGLTEDVVAFIKKCRADGMSWAAIECATGYTANWMQQALRRDRNET